MNRNVYVTILPLITVFIFDTFIKCVQARRMGAPLRILLEVGIVEQKISHQMIPNML